MPTTTLSEALVVEVASGELVVIGDHYEKCTIELDGEIFVIDLLPISLRSFDVVVGMDRLAANRAEILCYNKLIKLPLTDGGIILIYGEKWGKATTIISLLKARKCVANGCSSYLTYVVDAKLEKKGVTDVDVVREFPDVFPEDLPGLPPERQVEFHIDLTPGAAPIARTPYRLASTEMKE